MKYIGLRLSKVNDDGWYKSIKVMMYAKDGLDGEYKQAGTISLQADNDGDNWYGWRYELEYADYKGVKRLNFIADKIKEVTEKDWFRRNTKTESELLDYLSSQDRFKMVIFDDRVDSIVEIDNLLEQSIRSYVARDNKGGALARCVADGYPTARKKIKRKIENRLETGRYLGEKEELEQWLESEANDVEKLNTSIDFNYIRKIKEIGLGDYLDSLL